jgi:hypothetical protein
MLSVAAIGTILFLVYVLDSGFAIPFFQLRAHSNKVADVLNVITYFSPFSYIESFAQLAIYKLSYTNYSASIFDPNHNFSFPAFGGEY